MPTLAGRGPGFWLVVVALVITIVLIVSGRLELLYLGLLLLLIELGVLL